jgi:hypothetical protein
MQTKTVEYTEDGRDYRLRIEYGMCETKTPYFTITGTLYKRMTDDVYRDISCGCLHDDIEKHCPELAPLIKWHLCSADGVPMHYIPNTVYLAGDRDYNGLHTGEERQLTIDGKPVWRVANTRSGRVASETKPEPELVYWEPEYIVGTGKVRELEAAREAARWPEATNEQLCSDNLKELLEARLPALQAAFKADMVKFGVLTDAD